MATIEANSRFCDNCGNAMGADALFCSACGTSANRVDQAATQAASAPAKVSALYIFLVIAACFALLVFAIFALLGFPQLSSAPPPPTPEQQLIAKAEADVRDQMKDPTTAQFSEESANVAGNCVFGKVLGKNSFGAFAGSQGFVWHQGFVKFENDVGFLSYMDARLACIGSGVAHNPPS